MRTFWPLALLPGLAGFTRATEPAALPPPEPAVVAPAARHNLRFSLLVIAVPDAEALAWIPKLRDPAQLEVACAALQKLVAQKRARLAGSLDLPTRSGERAVTMMSTDIPYPSEFPPPPMPMMGPVDLAKLRAPATPPPTFRGSIPLWMETREIGLTMEIEGALDLSGMRIETEFQIRHTGVSGMQPFVMGRREAVRYRRPRFHFTAISTRVFLVSGEAQFLGSFPSPSRPGETEFFILRAAAEKMTK